MKPTLIAIGVLAVALLGFGFYMFVRLWNDTAPPSPTGMTNATPLTLLSVDPAAAPAPISAEPAPPAVPAADSTSPTASASNATQPIDEKIDAVLKETYPLVAAGKLDEALAVINPGVVANPNNPQLLSARAFIYSQQGNYDLERQDLNKAIELGDKSSLVKFNLAEIDFVLKNYDVARPGFLALESDPDRGDLSTYKVFLCDLLSGHDNEAGKELNALNIAGGGASYYFANIASAVYHHKPADAQPYLDSANRIFSPTKVEIYSTSLKNLGYLPLPTSPTN